MKSDTWLTPPEILAPLGEFELDPCCPENMPWRTAKTMFTQKDDGLSKEWFGRVWLNPPYGRAIGDWMKKMAARGCGISLVFARTETEFWHRWIWPFADSILFLEGRLNFLNRAGIRSKANAGAPSVLIAYGADNVESLGDSGIRGRHILINAVPVVIVGTSPSWKSVITIAVGRLNGTGHLQEIYDLVEQIAPDKIAGNGFYKEKIRQVLQQNFERIGKGKYSNAN